ncbi:hypothetical protein FRC12_009318 [Ceratobasidium sp. 428]|nr:hypothetical protein FRC12_009318 [Ceratobasidium sp. 428]
MNARPPKTKVSYDLPATIKAIQTGWLTTFQTASVISALLAVIESILLFLIHGSSSERFDTENPGGKALLVLNYLAFFFGISATFSSLLLTDEFGEIHVRASQRESALEPLDQVVINEDVSKLLTRYGARRITGPLIWHWIIMLLGGFLALVGQLLLYIWLVEAKPIAIGMSCVTGFALLPLLSIIPSK